MTIQMTATEKFFPVVPVYYIAQGVPTFESANEILCCDHSNESYWAALFCSTVYYAVLV